MEFSQMQQEALAIRERYATFEQKTYGKNWSREELALGFMGDVGDLMKLVQAKEGVRAIPDADEAIAHELADCLWSVICLAQAYDVDLEQAFGTCMGFLDGWLTEKGC